MKCAVSNLVIKYLTLTLEGKSCIDCDVFSSYYNDVYYNQGFQTGSIRQILSRLDEAEMSVVTCDFPASKSAKSEKRQTKIL